MDTSSALFVGLSDELAKIIDARLNVGVTPRIGVWPPNDLSGNLRLIVCESRSPAALAVSVRRSTAAPLIVLTSAPADQRAATIDLGATICLSRDESPLVIAALAYALIRTVATRDNPPPPVVTLGQLMVDVEAQKATVAGSLLTLSPKEFSLLAHLARNGGKVFRRHELLRAVWGASFVGDSNTIDVHIAWLRHKLGAQAGVRITTLRGVGYRLDQLEESGASNS